MAKRVPKTKCDVLKYYINGECAHKVQNPALHNLRVICAARVFYFTFLDQQQFNNLLVGTIRHIREFQKQTRTLVNVAQAILDTEKPNLDNWWIERLLKNVPRFEEGAKIENEEALILRELKPSEKAKYPDATYYLQDGTKRALAYGLAILGGKGTFQPVPVYVCDQVDFDKI